MNAIKAVDAFKWACPDCHDTGLAPSIADALNALDEHRDDYHAPIDWEDDPDLIEANRCPACDTTYEACPMPAAGCCHDCNHDK